MSIAVWVGLIALLGVDAETGVFMLLYLDLAYEKASREGRLRTLADLQEAIVDGAAKRMRPKVMTVATMFVGPGPDHVVHRHRVGRDEADRRADGRRHLHLVRARAGRLPGDLRDLEVALRDEARPRRTAARRARRLPGAHSAEAGRGLRASAEHLPASSLLGGTGGLSDVYTQPESTLPASSAHSCHKERPAPRDSIRVSSCCSTEPFADPHCTRAIEVWTLRTLNHACLCHSRPGDAVAKDNGGTPL